MNNIITNLKDYQKFNNLPFHIDIISPETSIGTHYHDCVEMIVVKTGTAHNHVDSFSFRHSRGNVFIISGQVAHTMFDFKDFSAYRILFDMSIFDDWDDEIKNSPGFVSLFTMSNLGVINNSYHSVIAVRGEYTERFEHIMDELLYAYNEGGNLAEEYIIQRLKLVVMFILSRFKERTFSRNSYFTQLYTYIMDNLNEKISITDFADKLKISRVYLHKLFVDNYGKTPTRFIKDMRVRNAKTLLTLTDKSITEIATSCGFENPVYFAEVFKSHEGVSPSQYRKKQKENR
ncbi:MAG: helix-turn-helix domain-containing protein [Clostridia bacterium]|nr:helix-turn-helix domain-containing protein [Clostridia bacterium]MBR2973395.1 helix-turn-helix domain-containing protein [Clostridia bacterium]